MTPGNCSLSLPPHPLSFSLPLLYCQATFGPFYWNIMQQSWWIFSSTEFSALHRDCALSENLTPQQPRPTLLTSPPSPCSTLQCHCIRCLPKAKRADVASSRRKAKNIIIAIENCWWAPSGCQTTTAPTNRPAKTCLHPLNSLPLPNVSYRPCLLPCSHSPPSSHKSSINCHNNAAARRGRQAWLQERMGKQESEWASGEERES